MENPRKNHDISPKVKISIIIKSDENFDDTNRLTKKNQQIFMRQKLMEMEQVIKKTLLIEWNGCHQQNI